MAAGSSAGDGWHITDGDLDLECGELLQTVLAAEQAVDPDNPTDTAEFEQLREQGWHSTDPLPDRGQGGPRSLRQKRHDALKNALRRYLDAGIAGMRDKTAPHVDVIVGIDLLEQCPGALPAVSASTGARLPTSLVRSWLVDSSVARFVLSLGGKVSRPATASAPSSRTSAGPSESRPAAGAKEPAAAADPADA